MACNSDTIYVVSGFMRSGTSMMMDCLQAGGLEAAFIPERDELNARHGDDLYKPNPNGFFELDREHYKDPDFPLPYKGKLVKCLAGGLKNFPVSKYKVIFMRRDKEEIRQSLDGFFNPPEQGREKLNYFFKHKFDTTISRALELLKNRKDTEVTEVWYRDVVRDPLDTFRTIAHAGWPIIMHKCASVVEPELCRFRREDLTIGI